MTDHDEPARISMSAINNRRETTLELLALGETIHLTHNRAVVAILTPANPPTNHTEPTELVQTVRRECARLASVAHTIAKHDITTLDAIRSADDRHILSLPQIGPTLLRRIRDLTGGTP